MGKYTYQQLSELHARANEQEDAVLDAVVRNKLWVNNVVRGVEEFIDAHGIGILKGALGVGGCGWDSETDASQQIAVLWSFVTNLDRYSDLALDQALERTKEQT